jgi:hypothetical protein
MVPAAVIAAALINGVGAATACTGSGSTLLPAEQCQAWIDMYDAAGGTAWKTCSDARVDPCSCSGTCNAGGTAIVNM